MVARPSGPRRFPRGTSLQTKEDTPMYIGGGLLALILIILLLVLIF